MILSSKYNQTRKALYFKGLRDSR